MCFFIDPTHREMKTAKRDITCYKNGYRIFSNFRPLCQISYLYALGELNKIKDWTAPVEAKMYGNIVQGFHSYSNKKRLSRRCDNVKCIIPKGAHYFYNSDNREYVSDQIIVQEFISRKVPDKLKVEK